MKKINDQLAIEIKVTALREIPKGENIVYPAWLWEALQEYQRLEEIEVENEK